MTGNPQTPPSVTKPLCGNGRLQQLTAATNNLQQGTADIGKSITIKAFGSQSGVMKRDAATTAANKHARPHGQGA